MIRARARWPPGPRACCCPVRWSGRSVAGRFARRACPAVETPQPVPRLAPGRASPPGPEEDLRREENVSAQRPQAGQEPRLPQPHVHPGRSRHPAQPSPEGPGQAVGLIGPIRDRRTFEALRGHGTRVRRGPLSLVYLAEVPEGAPRTRLAFAITRRVGSAVVRNRLRRRLRAVFLDLAPTLPAGAVLVSAGPGAVVRGPDELRDDVVRLLEALDHRLLREHR